MASFNKVILIGRLTRDPEMRYTSGGLAIAKFAVAVDRRFKNQQGEKETDFFDCSAFRQTAEFVSQYLGKGRLVAVEGRIEFNDVEGQDGQRRRYTNVICDQVQGLDSQREGGDNYGGGSGGGYDNAQGGYGGQDDYGQGQPAPQAQAPRTAAPPRPAAPQRAAGGMSGNAPVGGPPAGGAPQRPAPRQPEPAYPEDDYDDADPFADE